MTHAEELASRMIHESTTGAEISTILQQLSHLESDVAIQVLAGISRHDVEDAVRLLEGVAAGGQSALVAPAIEALSLHRSAAAAEALARIADGAPDKQVRKMARKGLHRLRAVGVSAAEAPAVVRAPAIARPSVRYYKGVVTSLDGEGTRAVMVGAERPSGIVDGIFALVNEEVGLKDCFASETSRKGFDRELDDVRAQLSSVTWVPAPPPYCHWLIDEHVHKGRAHGRLSAERERCARSLGPPQMRYAQPLIYERLPADELRGNPLWLQRGSSLFQEPEFHGWLLRSETLKSYAVSMLESRESRLVLSEWIKADREARIVARAIGEVFDRSLLDNYAGRLEEMAYVLLATDRDEPARVALSTALALREEPEDAVSANPFLHVLVMQSIENVLKSGLGGKGKIIIP